MRVSVQKKIWRLCEYTHSLARNNKKAPRVAVDFLSILWISMPHFQFTFCKNCVCKLYFTKKRLNLSYFLAYKHTKFLQRGKLCQPPPLTDADPKAVSVRPRPRRPVRAGSFPVPPVMSPGSRLAQRPLPAANG